MAAAGAAFHDHDVALLGVLDIEHGLVVARAAEVSGLDGRGGARAGADVDGLRGLLVALELFEFLLEAAASLLMGLFPEPPTAFVDCRLRQRGRAAESTG